MLEASRFGIRNLAHARGEVHSRTAANGFAPRSWTRAWFYESWKCDECDMRCDGLERDERRKLTSRFGANHNGFMKLISLIIVLKPKPKHPALQNHKPRPTQISPITQPHHRHDRNQEGPHSRFRKTHGRTEPTFCNPNSRVTRVVSTRP